jgi:hypothetical protein
MDEARARGLAAPPVFPAPAAIIFGRPAPGNERSNKEKRLIHKKTILIHNLSTYLSTRN